MQKLLESLISENKALGQVVTEHIGELFISFEDLTVPR